jgi:hypothetical protein
MESIFNDQTTIANIISAGAKQLIDNAKALGLTWTIRISTIVNSGPDAITGIMDGDTVPIGLTNMSGLEIRSGDRVYVIITPPSGNFISGKVVVEDLRLGANCVNFDSLTAGSTTSAVYVDQPGSPSLALTKKYDGTSLRFAWAQTYYTGSPVNALFAVTTAAGNQVFLAKHFGTNGATNSHTPISGVASAVGIPAGTMIWVGAWATAGGGGGDLKVDSGDFWSCCIEEFWPTD